MRLDDEPILEPWSVKIGAKARGGRRVPALSPSRFFLKTPNPKDAEAIRLDREFTRDGNRRALSENGTKAALVKKSKVPRSAERGEA